jgi:Rft protein
LGEWKGWSLQNNKGGDLEQLGDEMSVLEASARGASFLILFQVASRGFTFLLNQILLRFLSPETLGLSAQLDLFSITVLYFARESIRVACQRQSSGPQVVVNLACLSIVFGLLLSYGLTTLYLKTDVPEVAYFATSLKIYAVACIVELLSEPAFMISQQKLLFKVRASAESISTIGRCVSTCAAAFWAHRKGIDPGVLPFAVGQMTYSVLLMIAYMAYILPVATSEKFSLSLTKLQR